MNKWMKLLISAVVVLACLELISRHLLDLVPFETHRRYVTRADHTGNLAPVTNGRGARGEWPQKHAVQVALIGSSILGAYDMPSDKTWPEILKKKSDVPLHIDNYGVGYMKYGTALELLQSIKNQKIHYDIIVIQLAADRLVTRRSDYLSETFLNRWALPPKNRDCALCLMLSRFFDRQQNRDAFLKSAVQEIKKQLPEKPKPRQYHFFDREMYKKVRSEKRMEPGPTDIPTDVIDENNKLIPQVFSLAKSITPHVIWIPEELAYHPNMKDSYLQNYINLIPINVFKRPDYYYDEMSRVEVFNNLNQIVRTHAEKTKVYEMNWTNEIKNLLPTVEGLYYDEYHLSEAGHQKVAEIMLPQISKYISENDIKIENK